MRFKTIYNLKLSVIRKLRQQGITLANLRRADLSGADLNYLTIGIHNAPEGRLIGWKKCKNNVIVKLSIPLKAKRSCATTRKFRAQYAKVLDVINSDVGHSSHDNSFVYEKGKTVYCGDWDENRWNECSDGIHFFLTRKEAEAWN